MCALICTSFLSNIYELIRKNKMDSARLFEFADMISMYSTLIAGDISQTRLGAFLTTPETTTPA